MPPVHYRYATVQGRRLFYREAGPADAPAVVLLHGFPASSFMFRDLIPQLAGRYHVIAPDRELAIRAILAWDALARQSPGRLRPCANDECRLFLIDRSKANAARWCSMAVCGNRMKARRHYQRSRA